MARGIRVPANLDCGGATEADRGQRGLVASDASEGCRGNCFLARFADDFVAGFSLKGDAERVFKVLPKRSERYGLSIHPEKSRLVQFSRPYWKSGKGPGTFTFLGFTHYWARTLQGGWTIKRKTQGKRLSRFLSAMNEWCKKNLHKPLTDQHRQLTSKLCGHYQYYGVRGNFEMLEVAYNQTRMRWRKWLRRRNSKNRMSWERFAEQVERTLGLPRPRIIHVF